MNPKRFVRQGDVKHLVNALAVMLLQSSSIIVQKTSVMLVNKLLESAVLKNLITDTPFQTKNFKHVGFG